MNNMPTNNIKLLTGIMTEIMYHHLTQQGCLEAYQKGCQRLLWNNSVVEQSSTDHLLLNKARLENAKCEEPDCPRPG